MSQRYALLTLVFTLTFVASPAVTPPFTGFRPDQLPIPQIAPPIQPAGYAFAIWGLIYAWLVASAVFGIVRRGESTAWDRTRIPLLISLAVGTPWLAIANMSAIWATILLFVMAVLAILALLSAPEADKWWLKVPVGIFAGWLTAASFVSLGSTAAGYGFITDQLGWAYIGILGALAIAAPVLWRSASAPYGLTVVWALVGIIAANATSILSVAALAGLGVCVVIAIMLLSKQRDRTITS